MRIKIFRMPVIIAGIFVLCMIVSCSEEHKNETGSLENSKTDSLNETNDNSIDTIQKIPVKVVRIENGFKILSYLKLEGENSTSTKENCERWNLDSTKIRQLILGLTKISSEEHHYDFLVSGCTYEGKLLVEGDTVRFELNAGSFVYLNYPDSSFILADVSGKFRNYFLRAKSTGKGN